MKKSLLLLPMIWSTQALAGPPLTWGPDNKALFFQAGVEYPQSATPTGSPVAGYDYLYTKSDDNLYIKNSSGVETQVGGSSSAVTTMGAFGNTPNANGGSIATSTLTLQPADATHPGGVSTGTQSFGGQKSFAGINVNGAAATGVLNVLANGTNITGQFNLMSASGTVVYSFHDRDTGSFFLWDGNNVVMDFLNGQMGVGPSSPSYHLDFNKADSNTSQTAPGVVTVVANHNTDTTAGNLSTYAFVNSVPAIDSAIEGVHSTNSATYAGKLEFLTSTGGALAVHQEITETGQLNSKGTVPTIASGACGTLLTASVVGNDVTGRITVGTGGSATCTLTFTANWTNAPICAVVDETTVMASKATPAVGSVVFTAAVTYSAGDKLGYHCTGYL